MSLYRSFFKPLIDFSVSLVFIIVSSPLLIFIWIILLPVNRGSVFFIQKRPGKNERIFNIYKFQTMTKAKDPQGNLLPDNERITSFGRFLRNTSLDELPQLFNVIKGDISLVGPRPLLVEYLPLYNEIQKRRHDVKPGITGWAQVNGRNALSWKEKFEYDIWYVDNISLNLDLKILFLTIKKVFKSENVNNSKTITMSKFSGEN
jgi:undecaprenyl phosphate N,N'-diacetylbacillosamine 1-phosphate transferase